MDLRESAEQTELVATTHKKHARWLSAAGAFVASGVWWRRLRDLRRSESCLRAAAAALDRAADEVALMDERKRQRRARRQEKL